MEDPLITPKTGSNPLRERDVSSLYAVFQDIPLLPELDSCSPDTHAIPSSHVPKPASDASLAAFCQLAAMRLNASRSLISLIDDQYQYILAEATPQTSLRADSPLNRVPTLGFGNVRLPRRWGICERVLDSTALKEGISGIVIINDLTQSELHSKRSYVKDGPLRFYAGVPLRSLSGNIVGSVCILDDTPRNGLPEDDILYLQDLALTIMEYLNTYIIRDRHRRGAEGLYGLMSFAEGASTLQGCNANYQPSGVPSKPTPSAAQNQNKHTSDIPACAPSPKLSNSQPRSGKPPLMKRLSSERWRSVGDLQESLLPETIRELFSRAADIMRRSNDMDGVMFMDAAVAASGPQNTPPTMAGKRCQIMGFATRELSSLDGDILPGDMRPCESNFQWALKQYPNGYSLDCDDENAKPWTEEFFGIPEALQEIPGLQEADTNRAEHTARIKALIPGIKSALFMPLWDFERNRWFAGCFCWSSGKYSSRSERFMDGQLDLPFLKTFGHSIMQEVARLDAATTSQAKTTFLSSLSHELRTPLHGILGSAHLMRNSTLNSFQTSMVNSITVCGTTLLETVEHLLDHAERREPNQNYSSKTMLGPNSIRITSERLNVNTSLERKPNSSRCNVGLVTEEVVETMIIGQAPFNVSLESNTDAEDAIDKSSQLSVAKKRSRFIILDVDGYENLGVRLSASSYGRLVMNLFGNAMKFTESGFIHVSLRSEPVDDSKTEITLKIADSGVGMSKVFLANAFEPFCKENPHTPGTGVGLSVVKRILEDVGGEINIYSKPCRGTEITLKLYLDRRAQEEGFGPNMNPLPVAITGLKGRKVCIMYKDFQNDDTREQLQDQSVVRQFVDALSSTLTNVLKMNVYQAAEWDGLDDTEVVVCPELSFESLQIIRQNAAKAKRRCPATVVIAMDILEAETLRSDARVTSKESIVESVTQPCGPYKLSIAFNTCLKQYDITNPRRDSVSPTAAPRIPPTLITELTTSSDPRLGWRPPALALRTKSDPPTTDSPTSTPTTTTPTPSPLLSTLPAPLTTQRALLVDDNAINRRVLSVWMKKHRIPFSEAHDGLQALETYKTASLAPPTTTTSTPQKFNIILMDISMPVMDGMTSTRLIREHEKLNDLQPAHIIALTGLTSASAKLEAWTSGVDDFLTKPVDFRKLEGLVKAGRGGEGTGFVREGDGR